MVTHLYPRQFTAVTKALARQRTSKPKDHLAEFRAHVRLHDEELMVLYGKSNEDLYGSEVDMEHRVILLTHTVGYRTLFNLGP